LTKENEDTKTKTPLSQSDVEGLVSCDLTDYEIALLKRLLRIYISDNMNQGAVEGDLWVSIELKDKLIEAEKKLNN
jgi:hypothetical protein